MMPPLFIDNDIIWKLASCDLLEDMISVMHTQKSAVRILSTFKHRFGITNDRRRISVEQQIGPAAFQRIVAFHSDVSELEPVRSDLVSLFEDLPAIDAGEGLLFAAASEVPEAYVLTGDKRSIRCLSSAEKCRSISQNLNGRVICFEQLIKDVIPFRGFDAVKRLIVPAVECDGGLRAAFGSGLDAEEAQVHRVLDSYITELRGATGLLLRS